MSSNFVERRAAQLLTIADYHPEGSAEQVRLQALGRDLKYHKRRARQRRREAEREAEVERIRRQIFGIEAGPA